MRKPCYRRVLRELFFHFSFGFNHHLTIRPYGVRLGGFKYVSLIGHHQLLSVSFLHIRKCNTISPTACSYSFEQ